MAIAKKGNNFKKYAMWAALPLIAIATWVYVKYKKKQDPTWTMKHMFSHDGE